MLWIDMGVLDAYRYRSRECEVDAIETLCLCPANDD